MSTSNIGNTGDIGQLAARLMDRVDADRNGQLSREEFGAFLTSLLDRVATPTASPTRVSNAVISPTVLTRAASAPASYQPILGFDTGKLNNLAHTTTKYTFARTMQDLGLFGSPRAEHLQTIVDAMNAKGGAARVVGEDKIDFGDGYGAVDVIFDVGGPDARWQWLNVES